MIWPGQRAARRRQIATEKSENLIAGAPALKAIQLRQSSQPILTLVGHLSRPLTGSKTLAPFEYSEIKRLRKSAARIRTTAGLSRKALPQQQYSAMRTDDSRSWHSALIDGYPLAGFLVLAAYLLWAFVL